MNQKKGIELILSSMLLLTPSMLKSESWNDLFSRYSANSSYVKNYYNNLKPEFKDFYNNVYFMHYKKKSPFVKDFKSLGDRYYLEKFDKKYFQNGLDNLKKRKCKNGSCLNYIFDESIKKGVDPDLALSISFTESHFKHKGVKSKQDAIGLFQIIPPTAKSFCGLKRSELWSIEKNIQCGITYLSKIYKYKNTDSFEDIASGYHGGMGYIKSNSNENTREKLKKKRPNNYRYVKKVMSLFYELKKEKYN